MYLFKILHFFHRFKNIESVTMYFFLASQLIFTPATTVAAVQSDIPVVSSSSSSSCQSAATQVSLCKLTKGLLHQVGKTEK